MLVSQFIQGELGQKIKAPPPPQKRYNPQLCCRMISIQSVLTTYVNFYLYEYFILAGMVFYLHS